MFISEFTLAGPRANNEDVVFGVRLGDAESFGLVADGVGGVSGGKAAAECLKRAAEWHIARKLYDPVAVLKMGHKLVNDLTSSTAATTASAVYCNGDSLIYAHTGDSRICVVRRNGIRTLTTDQTEVVQLLREGVLTKEAAKIYHRRNVLRHSIEKGQPLNLEDGRFALESGDRVILMTDGIYKLLSKETIRNESLKFSNPEDLRVALCENVRDRLVDDASLILLQV